MGLLCPKVFQRSSMGKAFCRFSMAQKPLTGLEWHVDLLLVFYYPMTFFMTFKDLLLTFKGLSFLYKFSTAQKQFIVLPQTEDHLQISYDPKNFYESFMARYLSKIARRPFMGVLLPKELLQDFLDTRFLLTQDPSQASHGPGLLSTFMDI